MKKTEICRMCYKEFSNPRKNQRYCCPECKAAADKTNKAKSLAKQKRKNEENAKKKTLTGLSLSEVEKLARAVGLSYGEYSVKEGLGRYA